MSGSPVVSVVMSVHNGARHLRAAIDSILSQDHRELEFVIVDDCSSDDTPGILGSYSDPRIRVISHEKNLGLTVSLNEAVAASSGDYIVRQDADDISRRDRISLQVGFLEKNMDHGLVGSNYEIIDDAGRLLVTAELPLDDRSIRARLLSRNAFAHSALTFRRSLFDAVGGYRERFVYAQDYDLVLRMSDKAFLANLGETLLQWRFSARGKSVAYHGIQDSFAACALESMRRRWQGLSDIPVCDVPGNKAGGGGRYAAGYLYALALRKYYSSDIAGALRLWLGAAACSPVYLFAPFSAAVLKPLKAAGRLLRGSFARFRDSIDAHSVGIGRRALDVDPGRRRVLFVVPYLVAGGGEQVVLAAASALPAGRYQPFLFTTVPASHGWKARFGKVFAGIVSACPATRDWPRYYPYLRDMVRSTGCGLMVVSNSELAYGCLPFLKADFPGLKIVDILHTVEGVGLRPKWAGAAAFIDARVCVSGNISAYAAALYGYLYIPKELSKRLRVVVNGVDTALFDPAGMTAGAWKRGHGIDSAAKLVSFVGRFEPEKAVLRCVEIARNMFSVDRYSDIRFVFAGYGSQERQLRRMMAGAGLTGHCCFPGVLEREEVACLLRDTCAVIVPSLTEGCPLIVLEAMAMGVPVVATDVGGVSSLIDDGENGFIVPACGDVPAAMAGKLAPLLVDGSLWQRLSSNARDKAVARFSEEARMERYRAVIEGSWPS